jgi:hypothetical protein
MSKTGETKYEPLPPHTLSEAATAYVASLSEEGRQLHELATKMLGSSYFVERTHGFRKWVSAAAAAKQKT